jgi:hypothetical protein
LFAVPLVVLVDDPGRGPAVPPVIVTGLTAALVSWRLSVATGNQARRSSARRGSAQQQHAADIITVVSTDGLVVHEPRRHQVFGRLMRT